MVQRACVALKPLPESSLWRNGRGGWGGSGLEERVLGRSQEVLFLSAAPPLPHGDLGKCLPLPGSLLPNP